MNLESVDSMWKSFAKAVLPRDASSVQRQEMRRAFYGGAWAMLCEFRKIGEDAVSEKQGVAHMERLKTELEVFSVRMLQGKA